MSGVVGDSGWYVVQTQINAELKAARNLLRQGFEIYLPRYIFVQIDMATQRWRSIQSTFGVSHLVLQGSDPARVAPEVVNALRAREDDVGFVKLDQRPKFALGEKVRVLAGVFAENLGLFDGMADRDRVAILLDLLGRKVRVSLDADMVTAA